MTPCTASKTYFILPGLLVFDLRHSTYFGGNFTYYNKQLVSVPSTGPSRRSPFWTINFAWTKSFISIGEESDAVQKQ